MDTAAGMVNTTEGTEAEQIKSEFATLDENALDGLDALGRVHQARVAQSSRTLKTLTAEFGADDSRVETLSAAIDAANITVARIALMRQQMAAPKTQTAKSGWVLQGHVLDSQNKPLARHTVFLVDANKAFLRQYGFAYTDAEGFFQLMFAGQEDQAALPPMFLEVVNSEAKPAYLSTDAFTPVTGATAYQEIVLGTGGPILGDPPPEIRKVAIPPH